MLKLTQVVLLNTQWEMKNDITPNSFADELFYLHDVEVLLNDDFKPNVADWIGRFVNRSAPTMGCDVDLLQGPSSFDDWPKADGKRRATITLQWHTYPPVMGTQTLQILLTLKVYQIIIAYSPGHNKHAGVILKLYLSYRASNRR